MMAIESQTFFTWAIFMVLTKYENEFGLYMNFIHCTIWYESRDLTQALSGRLVIINLIMIDRWKLNQSVFQIYSDIILWEHYFKQLVCNTVEPENHIYNPYLGDFGNVRERHFWTKNPESLFRFWWRHTWPNIFCFMMILNYVSNTNYTLPGEITWRHR